MDQDAEGQQKELETSLQGTVGLLLCTNLTEAILVSCPIGVCLFVCLFQIRHTGLLIFLNTVCCQTTYEENEFKPQSRSCGD